MALKSGLSLYCYTIATSGQAAVGPINYGSQIESLMFTTTAPGGYGQLEATLRLKSVLLPRPELGLFARVALMAGPLTLFLGEIMQPELGYSEALGEYIKISALGAGNALRDDPLSVSYTLQTAQQIARDQLSRRGGYSLPLSTDNALLFPDNPAPQWSFAYTNRTMEEVIADIAIVSGDYQWGTWVHSVHAGGMQPGATQKDAAGFPLGQFAVQLRDSTTTHFTARVAAKDVAGWRISPSADRAYNAVSIDWYDPSQNPPVSTTVKTDSRLAGGGAQGTAPFRRRKYARDFTGTTNIGSVASGNIATLYLNQMKNVSNKVELTLRAVRDAQGNEIPLWMARADRNIAVPEMAVRGAQLPTAYTAGVNQFYIMQSRYQEDSSGAAMVTLECDNYWDRANLLVARLQQWADAQARANRTTGQVQQAGASETGICGGSFVATGAGQVVRMPCTFRTIMANVPSSVNVSAYDVSNVTSASVTGITANGFTLVVTTTAAGPCWYIASYTTVGN